MVGHDPAQPQDLPRVVLSVIKLSFISDFVISHQFCFYELSVIFIIRLEADKV